MPDLLQETKFLLRKLDLAPRKRMGQNFMVRADVLGFIRDSLSLEKGETVLEIGPGLGFLTRFLLETPARVVAVEKDQGLAKFLRKGDSALFGKGRCPLFVHQRDILDTDLEKDLGIREPVKVAGNIPYSITSPILEWMISQRKFISEAVLTVQWEVAERLRAVPGTKSWGPLSLFVQFYSEVSLLKKIPKTGFYPVPEVDSAVIRISFTPRPRFAVRDEKSFFSLVRHSFQKRRKMLINSLAVDADPRFSRAALLKVLGGLRMDLSRRPETLSIPEWIQLSENLLSNPPAEMV